MGCAMEQDSSRGTRGQRGHCTMLQNRDPSVSPVKLHGRAERLSEREKALPSENAVLKWQLKNDKVGKSKR